MITPVRRLAGVALLATLLACNADTSANAPPLPSVTLPAELDQVLRDYEGAYVLALERRAAGPWRIAADIANPNRP